VTSKFNIGDPVQLNSGGPCMLVVDRQDRTNGETLTTIYACEWYVASGVQLMPYQIQAHDDMHKQVGILLDRPSCDSPSVVVAVVKEIRRTPRKQLTATLKDWED
jgi:uncharacterized protein YodC (DUF2158 family)